jgi:1-acyl-sn-glycerol-3-phosphate acyltransferase
MLLILLGLKKEGINKVPVNGSIILAANHVSNWDPVIIGVALKRPIHFMAKFELFNNRFMGKLLTSLNAFPVKRGVADRRAIEKAIKLLRDGKVLGIFPEGARKKVNPNSQIYSGAAMLALKTGAQVVPVACIGTEKDLPIGWLQPFKVRFGEPINLEQYRNQKINSAMLEEVSKQIMKEITLLFDK